MRNGGGRVSLRIRKDAHLTHLRKFVLTAKKYKSIGFLTPRLYVLSRIFLSLSLKSRKSEWKMQFQSQSVMVRGLIERPFSSFGHHFPFPLFLFLWRTRSREKWCVLRGKERRNQMLGFFNRAKKSSLEVSRGARRSIIYRMVSSLALKDISRYLQEEMLSNIA